MIGIETKINGFETQKLMRDGYSAIIKYGTIERGNYKGEGTAIILLGVRPEDIRKLFVD